jgi:hypothetical protein
MATGVFSLRKVYIKQNENIDNRNFASWPESAVYGYFGGGYLPPPAASHGVPSSGYDIRIFTLDYSNENIGEIPATITGSHRAAVSNNFYGYYAGGSIPPGSPGTTVSCTITRLDFSNNTASNPGKNLPTSAYVLSATSNSSYGYFGGGRILPSYFSTITRLDFSSETATLPGKNLPTQRAYAASTSNNSYGYFGGGYVPTITCTISRLDFSNETVSDPGKNLPTSRGIFAAISSSSYGYFGGGYAPPLIYICTISRLDFSNETVSNPGKNLPAARWLLGAVSSSFYGYFGSGTYSAFAPNFSCIITRLDFSTETISDPGKNLPSKRLGDATCSGGASVTRPTKSFGYFCGGYYRNASPTALNAIGTSQLDFSTENVSSASGSASWGIAGVSNNISGYVANGSPESSVRLIDFNTLTTSLPGKNLPYSNQYSAGSSSNSYGYFAGGGVVSFDYYSTYGFVNTIARLDFSSETATNPGKNLLTARAQFAATSNSNYIYFGGGYVGGGTSTIERLEFSNETVSSPGKNLPVARRSLSSVSNNSYGYFNSGENGTTPFPTFSNQLEKLDFSTENVSLLPVGGTNRCDSAAVSSSFYGYFGGGTIPSPFVTAQECTISRLDFSTETRSDPGKNLPFRVRANIGLSN